MATTTMLFRLILPILLLGSWSCSSEVKHPLPHPLQDIPSYQEVTPQPLHDTSVYQKPTPQKDVIPPLRSLARLKQTAFAFTLEHPIAEKKNLIYTPTLLYAWESIVKKLGDSVVASPNNSPDFHLLTTSTSYTNSLKKKEYTIDTFVQYPTIIARAFFHIALPFPTELQVIEKPIRFQKSAVKAFGMDYFDEDIQHLANILYYQDDDHFVLQLLPEDAEHEIILVKGLENPATLSDAVQQSTMLIHQGEENKRNAQELWKYTIKKKDIIAIPVLSFNLETNYPGLEGQDFNNGYVIKKAYQRTAFVFNEKGAIVESYAEIHGQTAVAPLPGKEKERPKKLVLDKTFYIIIKRIDKTNPYFVMKVDNAELMTPAVPSEE